MKSIRLALCAGALALAGAAAQAQTSTNTLSLTTFGPDTIPPWGYDYFYGDSSLGVKTYNRSFYLPEDTDMTNGMWQLTHDSTALVDVTNWGWGTGGPLSIQDPSFTSGDRADYILSFDARAEGLLEGQANANGQMEFRFLIPDLNIGGNNIFQVNIPFQPTAEWKTFTFSLADGNVASGDRRIGDTEFELEHLNTSSLEFNVNFHEPFRQFGYDAENAFYLDNVKLEVINRAPAVQYPTTLKTIAEWNLDDKPINYDYSYNWSQNDNRPIFSSTRLGNDLGVEGSVGWALQMDNTTLAENTPQWAGGGMGGTGPVDFTLMDSGDLAHYKMTFDAKALGVIEGRTGSGVLQVFVAVPDDTLQPADENTDTDTLIRLDFPINGLSSEFKTYTFAFNKAGVGGGSRELFAANTAAISELRTQWQIENATASADWGFDADNALVLDNIKFERIVVDTLPITATQEGNELVLNWTAPETGVVSLQSSTDVAGPYLDVAGATAPYRTTMTGNRFYRLSWTPPVTP